MFFLYGIRLYLFAKFFILTDRLVLNVNYIGNCILYKSALDVLFVDV
jgi:hypothetical protein